MGQLGLSPQGKVVVGVLVGLISTSVQSLGLTLQRQSHILEEEKDSHDLRRPPHRRRRWQLGMFMFIVSNILGSTIQITTLPLPVLSTLQASGLVFNSICATIILGEAFTRWSLIGTLLVCGGAVLIAIFGAIGAPAHSLSQLLALLGRRQFVLWMIGQAILVAAIISSAKSIKYLNPRHSASPRIRLVRGMAYGCISGILSAHSLLVAKSAVELLLCTIFQRDNQFNRWESWVILLGLLALALSQLYYLHRGLKLCSTSVLYPFVFCVYNIIAILDGLIYFHQTSLLSVLDAVLIALGTVILLTGVLALSWRLNADPTVRSPITPKTPLTPGMGVVAPSPTASTLSTTLTPSSPSIISDEETPHQKHALSSYQPHPRIRSRTIGYNPRAPTFIFPNSDSSKHIRPQQQAMTESEEIWEELDDASPLPPLSPFSHQNFSSRHSSAAHRNSVPRLNANNDDITPDGETAPLLSTSRARINTGRTYRERRRRSAPALGEDSTEAAQNAMGGWWQMPWWSGGGSNSRGSGTRADSKIQDENQEREHDADR